jgi:McrBC 5-methylcytosine restriction system component
MIVIDHSKLQEIVAAYKMATFSDDHMNRLFEKFVLEYYRYHFPKLSAYPDQISWDITDRDTAAIDFLPSMKTDITLHKGDRTLIIDTKYYGRMMQEQFDKQTIHSGNLYQIFTYVKNLDSGNTGNVSGMLLYARTQEGIAPDLDAHFGANRIMVRTLDLNCDFSLISKQLNYVVEFVLN